jgi:hypothetical protein
MKSFGTSSLKMVFLLVVFFLIAALPLAAQSSTTKSPGFDMTGLPQWSKDLRRGEIVAFGSFPFTFFFTTFFMDIYRSSNHDWDRRYAPWPVKAAGAVNMTHEEQILTLGVAIGSSILVAVADHLIVRYQRNKQEREIRNLPEGTPIIIRQPMESSPEETLIALDTESEIP